MNDVLITALPSTAVAVALLFLGGWENERRTRRTEARKDAAASRAAFEAQIEEFVGAVMALKIAGIAHDTLYGGWRAKAVVIVRALGEAVSAHAGASGRGAVAAANRAAGAVVDRWDQASAASAAGLAAPLTRLGAAAAPLMRRQEPGVKESVEEVLAALNSDFSDEERITRGLTAFNEATQAALEPPAASRRRRSSRRS
ncbi:hypothetical protein [Streptomyces lavendulocolor]|uniref:hypothetical protein n=1 Tax=Streptomyces lavendulocolor TaxID=67316 RepID=UPI0031E27E39